MKRNETLQALCRGYLERLRYTASKHGLGKWLDDIVRANRNGECEATEREVNLLSRAVDDERLLRSDIPAVLGKSYRKCCEDGDFDRIKKLKSVGVYSKVSALLKRKK